MDDLLVNAGDWKHQVWWIQLNNRSILSSKCFTTSSFLRPAGWHFNMFVLLSSWFKTWLHAAHCMCCGSSSILPCPRDKVMSSNKQQAVHCGKEKTTLSWCNHPFCFDNQHVTCLIQVQTALASMDIQFSPVFPHMHFALQTMTIICAMCCGNNCASCFVFCCWIWLLHLFFISPQSVAMCHWSLCWVMWNQVQQHCCICESLLGIEFQVPKWMDKKTGKTSCTFIVSNLFPWNAWCNCVTHWIGGLMKRIKSTCSPNQKNSQWRWLTQNTEKCTQQQFRAQMTLAWLLTMAKNVKQAAHWLQKQDNDHGDTAEQPKLKSYNSHTSLRPGHPLSWPKQETWKTENNQKIPHSSNHLLHSHCCRWWSKIGTKWEKHRFCIIEIFMESFCRKAFSILVCWVSFGTWKNKDQTDKCHFEDDELDSQFLMSYLIAVTNWCHQQEWWLAASKTRLPFTSHNAKISSWKLRLSSM